MADTAPWTYSGDPSTSRLDEVRFLIQDTDSDLKLLSNPEIQYLIDFWDPIAGSTLYIAYMAARSISAKFAGVLSVSADGVTVPVGDLQKRFSDLALQLLDQFNEASVGGDIDLTGLMVGARNEPGIAPLSFSMGLFDNQEAGQQNYGGDRFYPVVEWCGQ